jgi:hypothetical protein
VEPSRAVVRRISPGLGRGFFSFSGFFFFFFFGGVLWIWAVLIVGRLLIEFVPRLFEFAFNGFDPKPFTFRGLVWSRFKLGSVGCTNCWALSFLMDSAEYLRKWWRLSGNVDAGR